MGLSLPFDKIEVDVGRGTVELRVLDPVVDETARWELSHREIDGHVVVTCIERGGTICLQRAVFEGLLGSERVPHE